MDGGAPAMGIALKTKFAALEFSAHQQGGGGGDNT